MISAAAEVQRRLWGTDPRTWAELAESHNRPLFEAVLDAAGAGPGTRLLDVGCGSGLTLVLAAERGAIPAGLDISPGLLGIALPLYVVTMAGQNVPGTAVLATYGYRVPWREAMTTTGAGTILGAFAGGHAVVRFNNLRVPASDILGEPGKGFRYAQVRLAPARLTHCMRWLGTARRAHDIATSYARKREVFGAKLVNHEGVGFMLADNEIDIRMSRLAIWHTAWLLDQGARGTTESSMAKVFCSEAIFRVVDRCVQVLGGRGYMRDSPVERLYRDIRVDRIWEGTSEIQRIIIAGEIAKRGFTSLLDIAGNTPAVR